MNKQHRFLYTLCYRFQITEYIFVSTPWSPRFHLCFFVFRFRTTAYRLSTDSTDPLINALPHSVGDADGPRALRPATAPRRRVPRPEIRPTTEFHAMVALSARFLISLLGTRSWSVVCRTNLTSHWAPQSFQRTHLVLLPSRESHPCQVPNYPGLCCRPLVGPGGDQRRGAFLRRPPCRLLPSPRPRRHLGHGPRAGP